MIHLLPWLAWIAASSALAGEFKSQRGFSLTYPDGWSLATKEPQPDGADQPKTTVPNAPDVNLDKVAVFIYHSAPTTLGENVNVVVVAGRFPMTDESCAKYRAGLIEQYTKRGATVSKPDCRLIKLGPRDAVSWHCDVQLPGPVPLMRQWQLVLSSRTQAFIITCTAPASAYDKMEPIFTRIVESVQLEPDRGFSLDALSPVARGAIIGAVIGLLVGGIVAVVKLARRKPTPTV
jgi:hypothetical protein